MINGSCQLENDSPYVGRFIQVNGKRYSHKPALAIAPVGPTVLETDKLWTSMKWICLSSPSHGFPEYLRGLVGMLIPSATSHSPFRPLIDLVAAHLSRSVLIIDGTRYSGYVTPIQTIRRASGLDYTQRLRYEKL